MRPSGRPEPRSEPPQGAAETRAAPRAAERRSSLGQRSAATAAAAAAAAAAASPPQRPAARRSSAETAAPRGRSSARPGSGLRGGGKRASQPTWNGDTSSSAASRPCSPSNTPFNTSPSVYRELDGLRRKLGAASRRLIVADVSERALLGMISTCDEETYRAARRLRSAHAETARARAEIHELLRYLRKKFPMASDALERRLEQLRHSVGASLGHPNAGKAGGGNRLPDSSLSLLFTSRSSALQQELLMPEGHGGGEGGEDGGEGTGRLRATGGANKQAPAQGRPGPRVKARPASAPRPRGIVRGGFRH